MRFDRHDLIFNLSHTSFFSPENYFPNPAGRPKIFFRIPPAGRNYFPNPAGRPNLFFPNPAGRSFLVKFFNQNGAIYNSCSIFDRQVHWHRHYQPLVTLEVLFTGDVLIEPTSGNTGTLAQQQQRRQSADKPSKNFLRSAHATDPSIANFFSKFLKIFADNVKPNFKKW